MKTKYIILGLIVLALAIGAVANTYITDTSIVATLFQSGNVTINSTGIWDHNSKLTKPYDKVICRYDGTNPEVYSECDVVCSDSDCSDEIEECNGKECKLRAGLYPFTSNIDITSGTSIIGSGKTTSGTVLNLNGNSMNLQKLTDVTVKSLRFNGTDSEEAILLGSSGTSRNFVLEDLYFYNVSVALASNSSLSNGLYDSTVRDIYIEECGIGLQVHEIFGHVDTVTFRRNRIAVNFNVSTTPMSTLFSKCVFSGNDYDFYVQKQGVSFTCDTCWFENEGARSLGLGNGNVFISDLSSAFIRPLLFDNSILSKNSHLNLSWVENPQTRKVVLRDSWLNNWNSLGNVTGKHPNYIRTSRYDESGAEHRIMHSTDVDFECNVWSEGRLFYNTSINKYTFCDSSTWVPLT